MKINCAHKEIVELHKLQVNPKNPNKHPAEQIELLAKIIDYQGQRSPIVVSNRSGFITKGHGRLEAIRKLGWASAAVDYQDYDNEAQEYADMVADNKIAELAKHDDAFMLETISNMDLSDLPSLDLLGMLDFKLPEIFEPQADEDSVPENVDTRAKPGDVWQLGRHRLMCGDSTNIQHVEQLMNGEKADMIFSDPPYRVSFKGQRFSSTTVDGKKVFGDFSANNKYDEIANDGLDVDAFRDFIRTVLSNFFVSVKPKHTWYFCFAQSELHLLLNGITEAGARWKNIIIWMKNQANLSNMDYKSRYEPIVYFQSGGRFFGERYKTEDIWEFQRTLKNDLHPTMKPIPLIEFAIKNSSEESDLVIDFFGGSGSTLIACEKTNRNCFMMELDPKYCDVILARWEKYAGKTAELISG